MKQTLRKMALLGTLLVPFGLMAPRPGLASPNPPPIRPFAGGFTLGNGQVIQIEGFVHLNAVIPVPPPISPQGPTPPPIRVHTNLLNTRAVNLTTGQRYAGTGSDVFQGVVTPLVPFSFIATYRLTPIPPPIHQGQPIPPPILPLSLGFDAVLHLDGSLQVLSLTVLPPVPPTGDS